jgi:hypothetical protein
MSEKKGSKLTLAPPKIANPEARPIVKDLRSRNSCAVAKILENLVTNQAVSTAPIPARFARVANLRIRSQAAVLGVIRVTSV